MALRSTRSHGGGLLLPVVFPACLYVLVHRLFPLYQQWAVCATYLLKVCCAVACVRRVWGRLGRKSGLPLLTLAHRGLLALLMLLPSCIDTSALPAPPVRMRHAGGVRRRSTGLPGLAGLVLILLFLSSRVTRCVADGDGPASSEQLAPSRAELLGVQDGGLSAPAPAPAPAPALLLAAPGEMLQPCNPYGFRRVTVDIVASPGDNVTLPCVGPKNVLIKAVEWFRSLFYKCYVYLWRGGDRPDTENQCQSYIGRVHVKNLEEEKRKDTNVSLTIINVTSSDSGKYGCHIFNGTVDHSVIGPSFGTKSSRNVTLAVVDEVIPVCPGEDVRLTCDVPKSNVPVDAPQCHEEPVQPGRLSDWQTSNNTFSVMMRNAQPDDSGVYECYSNSSSEVKKRVHVIVSAAGEKKRCATGPGPHTMDPSQLGWLALIPVLGFLAYVGYCLYKKHQENLIAAQRHADEEAMM